MSSKTLMLIYHAFFNSVLKYGSIACSVAYKNDANLLQQIQNNLSKIISMNIFIIKNNSLDLEKLFIRILDEVDTISRVKH